jgi:predicted phosphodiesterase
MTKLDIPCFIINGNHDFWTDGNYYWEEYLSPIEKVMSFQFQGVRFVGINLFDANGLTSNQKTDIQNAFRQSTGTRIFFIHHDYQDELSSIYSQNGIDIALRGHEHTGKLENVGSTLEIYSDNSIELNTGEPGHYRVIYMNSSGEMNHESEIQTGDLFANFTISTNQEDEIACYGTIENYGEANFTNLVQEVDLLGSWQLKNGINVSRVEIFYNETHSKLLVHTSISSGNNKSYEVYLEQKVQETSLTTLDSTSDDLTSHSNSNQQVTTAGVNFLGVIMILCVIIEIMKRSIKK